MRNFLTITLLSLWLMASSWLPDGGEGGEGGEGAEGGDGGEGDEGGNVKTFTQAEVDRIVKNKADKMTKSALQSHADEWGVSLEEAGDLIKTAQDTANKNKSEAEKATAAATAERTKLEQERAELKAEKLQSRAERALLKAGMSDDALDTFSPTILATLPDDADADDIADAVDAFKTGPGAALFGGNDGEGKGGGGKPAPSHGANRNSKEGKSGKGGTASSFADGAAAAAAKFGTPDKDQ